MSAAATWEEAMPRIAPGAAFGAVVCTLVVCSNACVNRPVVPTEPVTHTNFVTSIPQGAIDKVDLLFDIDNSASMGDKQAYLSQAIPDLVTRLVRPNCVVEQDGGRQVPTGARAEADGTCPAGATAEFPPVHDLHVGILSSSLGNRLGDLCPTDPSDPLSFVMLPHGATVSRHDDDQAHLLDRSAVDLSDFSEAPLGAAEPDHFLNWFPPSSGGATPTAATGPMPITDAAALESDFQKLVIGVHAFGCGIESQLETWYRFLVQPDPYASLGYKNGATSADKGDFAVWKGVDTTILQQRADFLRPDSLVAIVVLTDENDSEIDVRSVGGEGWKFLRGGWLPPRGTSACQSSDPATVASAACTNCGFGHTPDDPQCKTEDGVYSDATDWGYNPNLRHVHQREKYGLSAQFPIERYVLGLTAAKVPDRDGEYPPDETSKSGYAPGYQGLDPARAKCTNPLFAAKLPKPSTSSTELTPELAHDLCALPPGNRKQNLIFYAHIGGVPHQLLQVDPTNPDSPQKGKLSDDDWTLILGKDPQHFDYSGIDPHMVESFRPRTGVPVPPRGFRVADPGQPEGSDPIAGREWITDSTSPLHSGAVDLEYACTFRLSGTDG
jgi:hypothetical protein